MTENIIVKNIEAPQTSSSLVTGKRILICGTTKTNKLFFAIYNTAYNITEYLREEAHESSAVLKEVCKDIEIDLNTGYVIILSQLTYSTSKSAVEIKALDLNSIIVI